MMDSLCRYRNGCVTKPWPCFDLDTSATNQHQHDIGTQPPDSLQKGLPVGTTRTKYPLLLDSQTYRGLGPPPPRSSAGRKSTCTSCRKYRFNSSKTCISHSRAWWKWASSRRPWACLTQEPQHGSCLEDPSATPIPHKSWQRNRSECVLPRHRPLQPTQARTRAGILGSQ